MGILRHHLDILFTETSKNNFIKGEVLCLGQQALYLTFNFAKTTFIRKSSTNLLTTLIASKVLSLV